MRNMSEHPMLSLVRKCNDKSSIDASFRSMRRYASSGARRGIHGLSNQHGLSSRLLDQRSCVVLHQTWLCRPFPTCKWRFLTTSQPRYSNRFSKQDEISGDTIYALSTAPGRAGIAIIRISGPSCLDIYRSLCPMKLIPKPRFASVRTLYEPSAYPSANILDSDAIVIYFPAPRSVTGEDVLELHIHGGPATVKAVLAAISACVSSSFIRYAEAGEFTKIAFQNNRLDLAQVEALSDTLSAETEQQLRAAVRGNSGALGRTYEGWRQQLLEARGELEAIIDFSEDQYFDNSNAELLSNIDRQVMSMMKSIAAHEEASRRGELLRKGIRISMLGHPNAGKSSLLNLIVQREASIVSAEAGTTRDVVEVSLDIEGYLCTFADTAGLRSSALENISSDAMQVDGGLGKVELEGIRRAKAKAIEADVVLVIASVESLIARDWLIQYDLEALQIASQAQEFLVVVNKVDQISAKVLGRLMSEFKLDLSRNRIKYRSENLVTVSCIDPADDRYMHDTGSLQNLMDRLVSSFKTLTKFEDESLLGVTERQRQLLVACKENCEQYLEEAHTSEASEDLGEDAFDIVLAAEHLRSAANCLSRITGRGDASDVEEVLGVVFEKFCVGK